MRKIFPRAGWFAVFAGVLALGLKAQMTDPVPAPTGQQRAPAAAVPQTATAVPQAATSTPQAAAPASQDAPGSQQRAPVTTIQAHARAVLVDVVVTDGHGHAVHGLKPTDFQVEEDRTPQTIKSFEEIRPKSEAERTEMAAGPKLPKNTFTNESKVLPTGAMTVLLLDALDTNLSAQAYSREQLVKYLVDAKPAGPVAIFQLDMQLHMIQGFTTDMDLLRAAVKDRDKLMQTVIPRTPGYVAMKFRYDGLTHGMQDLGRYLAQFPGRKNLIWFTGSVPVYAYDDGTPIGGALRDRESFAFDYTSTTDVLTLGRVSVYPVDAEGLRTNPAFSAARGGRPPSMGEISSFGIREAGKHEDLDDVAHATGGRAFYNTNGIKEAISEVIETGANYYTISYYPTNKNWDGKFRTLKLDLNLAGAQLEYRRGYYAMKESGIPQNGLGTASGVNAVASGPARRQITNHASDSFVQSMQLGAIDPGTIVFETHVTASAELEKSGKGAAAPADNHFAAKYREKPYREYVMKYVVGGKQLQLTSAAMGLMRGKVEFVLLVLDDKGDLVNSASATVDMNLKPETYRYVLTNGVEMPVKIQVPVKGTYFLRAGVHDVSSGRSGALEVAVGEIAVTP